MKKIFAIIFGFFLAISCEEFVEPSVYKTKGGFIEIPDSTQVSDTTFSYSKRDRVLHEGEQLWAIWYDSYSVVAPAQSNGDRFESKGNLAQDYNENRNYILIVTNESPHILPDSGVLWVKDIFGDIFMGFKIAHRVR